MKIPDFTRGILDDYLKVTRDFSPEIREKFFNSTYAWKWFKAPTRDKYTIDVAINDFLANTKYLDNNLVEEF